MNRCDSLLGAGVTGLLGGWEERERRLNEDYADATPAALDELNGQSDRLRAEIQTLSSQLGEVGSAM